MPDPLPTVRWTESRIRQMNARPVRAEREIVLYWMVAQRRCRSNFALQRAVDYAQRLDKPLVILEALRVGYPWASDRLHTFIVQGMADNQRVLTNQTITYYPYIEPAEGHGAGLLEALSERAAVVVTDDFPCFFIPRMVEAASQKIDVRLEAVDSNGLLPMRATDRVFARAFDFRRWLHKNLPPYLREWPHVDPMQSARLPRWELPEAIASRWPAADPAAWLQSGAIAELPVDHSVGAVAAVRGGSGAAHRALAAFLDRKLAVYGDRRNRPEDDATSGLSPWLHFGHISTHEVFRALAEREDDWSATRLNLPGKGQREGFWGMSPAAEGFLDQLITWRELGYNLCSHTHDFDQWSSLPNWARTTLEEHASDTREHVYTLEEFDGADTHDPLWNAAQNQLRREGRIHNYLRMLWGKKVLHWTAHPADALEILLELNNRYALDGRNPNSYSGIFWIFGRYDRAWGPERPIFGKIRYMTSQSTRTKYRVDDYIRKYGPHRT